MSKKSQITKNILLLFDWQVLSWLGNFLAWLRTRSIRNQNPGQKTGHVKALNVDPCAMHFYKRLKRVRSLDIDFRKLTSLPLHFSAFHQTVAQPLQTFLLELKGSGLLFVLALPLLEPEYSLKKRRSKFISYYTWSSWITVRNEAYDSPKFID